MKEASRTRPLDVIWIADSLGRIEELVPGLAGKIDTERLVAAGHSLGGGTAMAVTGLTLIDPNDDTLGDVLDERFDLLLLITNPGNNPMMPEDPWRVVAVPAFVATGTKDYSALAKRMKRGSGFRFPDNVSFADTPNHFLMIQDMDHYLGGLICRNDVDGPPDHDAVDKETANHHLQGNWQAAHSAVLTDRHQFKVKIQRLPCQWVVAVNRDGFFLNGGDHQVKSLAIGPFSLERHSFGGFHLSGQCVPGNILNHLLVVYTIGILSRNID
jgi:hypothetical protein